MLPAGGSIPSSAMPAVRDTDFADLDLVVKRFDDTFNLNVRGYLFAAQAFAALVQPGQANPSIVCVGSTNSLAAEKNSVIYDSQGAVLMLIRSLVAVTLAPRGIRVNGIGPGIIDTPLTSPGLSAPGVRDALLAQNSIGENRSACGYRRGRSISLPAPGELHHRPDAIHRRGIRQSG